MLYWALVFLLIAIVAFILGFTTLFGAALMIFKFLFVLFIIIAVISLIMGFAGRRPMH